MRMVRGMLVMGRGMPVVRGVLPGLVGGAVLGQGGDLHPALGNGFLLGLCSLIRPGRRQRFFPGQRNCFRLRRWSYSFLGQRRGFLVLRRSGIPMMGGMPVMGRMPVMRGSLPGLVCGDGFRCGDFHLPFGNGFLLWLHCLVCLRLRECFFMRKRNRICLRRRDCGFLRKRSGFLMMRRSAIPMMGGMPVPGRMTVARGTVPWLVGGDALGRGHFHLPLGNRLRLGLDCLVCLGRRHRN